MNSDGPKWDSARVCARLSASGFEVAGAPPPVSWFGDDAAMARELGELVRQGRKRATAGLLWRWETLALPRVGDRQVIVDFSGEPLAVIEMTGVRIVPYDEVDGDFAREEGEGDLSLAHWRAVHWEFFERECARLGRVPDERMPVVCMRFRLVHRVEDRGTP